MAIEGSMEVANKKKVSMKDKLGGRLIKGYEASIIISMFV
jgi:hypothetical protein